MSRYGETFEYGLIADVHQAMAITPESDEVLAARAASDPLATEELYRRYVNRVHAYCRRRLQDEDAIRDATSAIMLKALEGLYRSRVRNVSSWIFSIAHNEVIDTYRRRRSDVGLEFAAHVADGELSLESRAVAESDLRQLRELIAQLSPDQQSVIELRLAGLDGGEICAALGKRRSWVDTTQFRAIRKLRDLMNPPQESEAR